MWKRASRTMVGGFLTVVACSEPRTPADERGYAMRSAVAMALGKVDVQGCHQPGGPTGTGHVVIRFEADGSVSSAVIDEASHTPDSVRFIGTPVGACVESRFREVRVPAFDSGAGLKVGKTFFLR